jgi:hypothetical protein
LKRFPGDCSCEASSVQIDENTVGVVETKILIESTALHVPQKVVWTNAA